MFAKYSKNFTILLAKIFLAKTLPVKVKETNLIKYISDVCKVFKKTLLVLVKIFLAKNFTSES